MSKNTVSTRAKRWKQWKQKTQSSYKTSSYEIVWVFASTASTPILSDN
jgi:hypothetical protein